LALSVTPSACARTNPREPDANVPDGGSDADCRSETCNARDDDCDGSTDEGANAECALEGYVGVCVGGLCAHECAPARGDCDGERTNGCEVSLTDDRQNCGACGRACDVTELCEAGICRREHIVDFAVGVNVCVVVESGRVLCSGQGRDGANGDGTTEDRDYPVEVLDVENVVQISNIGEAPCALTADGDVWCWGYNENGVVRMPQSPWEPPTRREDVRGATRLDNNGGTACVILEDHSVWCWGHRVTGNNRPYEDTAWVAEQVPGLEAIDFGFSDIQWRTAITVSGDLVGWGSASSRFWFEPGMVTVTPRAIEGVRGVHGAWLEARNESRLCVILGPEREAWCRGQSFPWTPVGLSHALFVVDEAPYGAAVSDGLLFRWPTPLSGPSPTPFEPRELVERPGRILSLRTSSSNVRRCAQFDRDRIGCWLNDELTLHWVPGFD
jgi:hypothetical protein